MELKYQKRHWNKKTNYKVVRTEETSDGLVRVVFSKSKYILETRVYKDKLKEQVLKLKPNDSVNIWFIVRSIEKNNYWFNNVYLMHLEPYKKPKKHTPPISMPDKSNDLFEQRSKEF